MGHLARMQTFMGFNLIIILCTATISTFCTAKFTRLHQCGIDLLLVKQNVKIYYQTTNFTVKQQTSFSVSLLLTETEEMKQTLYVMVQNMLQGFE